MKINMPYSELRNYTDHFKYFYSFFDCMKLDILLANMIKNIKLWQLIVD